MMKTGKLIRPFAALAAFGLLGLALLLQHTASEELAQAKRGEVNRSSLHAVPPEAGANNNGVYYASKGQYDEAIGSFRSALEFRKDYLPAYKNLLAACVETKRWTEARQVAEKAEELCPMSALIRREALPEDPEKEKQLREDRGFIANLGRAYLETGELSKAASRFTLFLRLAPTELEGYNGLGETALRQGDCEKALRLFGQSLKLYGDQPEITAKLSDIAKKSTDLAGKAQWVLANYVQRGPGPAAGPCGGGPAGVPPEPVPMPRGAQLPQAPLPGQEIPGPQVPVPESPTGLE